MIKVAIIQYPGSNCEYETVRAVLACGMNGEIFRWNRNPRELKRFDAYIIPGGFSYQDRVRAGAIAAKKPIIERLFEEVEKGKPLLGICNGAQILVEAGMVPGFELGKVEMALGPNKIKGRSGYYCDWVWVKVEENRSLFTLTFKVDEVFPLPIAHAEGRFLTTKDTLDKMIRGGQVVLRYCRVEGKVEHTFPVNPNGSMFNLAAVSNPKGNVLAIMPHPERASFVRQIPDGLGDRWANLKLKAKGNHKRMEAFGPGSGIFISMRKYLEKR
jgi:phosphoribosylformylglycinamidine synthase